MTSFTVIDRPFPDHTFTVTEDKVPSGYQVWNVGPLKGYEDYIPFCICYSGSGNVQTDRLLAVKVADPEERWILRKVASRYGVGNIQQLKRRVNRKGLKGTEREFLERARPILERLT